MNRKVEIYLRFYLLYHEDDWYMFMPGTKLLYNSSVSDDGKASPFELHGESNPKSALVLIHSFPKTDKNRRITCVSTNIVATVRQQQATETLLQRRGETRAATLRYYSVADDNDTNKVKWGLKTERTSTQTSVA